MPRVLFHVPVPDFGRVRLPAAAVENVTGQLLLRHQHEHPSTQKPPTQDDGAILDFGGVQQLLATEGAAVAEVEVEEVQKCRQLQIKIQFRQNLPFNFAKLLRIEGVVGVLAEPLQVDVVAAFPGLTSRVQTGRPKHPFLFGAACSSHK